MTSLALSHRAPLQETLSAAGKAVTPDTIRAFAWETLKAGKVVPGYGHAVLRTTDPRYLCQREFALKHLPDDPLFQLVDTVFQACGAGERGGRSESGRSPRVM